MCSLRDESSRFAEYDVQVFGISVQDAQSHRKFVDEHSLNFPLLVDTGFNLNLLFEAMNDADGERSRVTIVVAEEGHITHIDRSVRAKTHGKDLVDLFRFV